MPASLPADFAFEPKVWADHIDAFFRKKLLMGQLAVIDNTLTSEPGMTVNFPYFKSVSAAEELAPEDALSVDKLQDDAFSATVKEIGKGVGVRKAALYKSAASREKIMAEIQRQIGRVHAEKIDADLLVEVNTSGNYAQGYTSSSGTDYMSIAKILQAKVTAFGDQQDEAIAIHMHSQHFLNLMTDSTAGFLKADANDPFWGMPGFQGRLLGMALFLLDQLPRNSALETSLAASKRVHEAFIYKMNPYGILVKQDAEVEMDYDMLHREWVFAGNQWYAVKAFHAKVSAEDLRIARMSVVTQLAL